MFDHLNGAFHWAQNYSVSVTMFTGMQLVDACNFRPVNITKLKSPVLHMFSIDLCKCGVGGFFTRIQKTNFDAYSRWCNSFEV